MSELELGLDPAVPKKVRVTREHTTYSWTKDSTKNRALCDLCIVEVPKVNGVPIHALNRSAFVERGPEGTKRLCAIHKQAREEAVAA